MNKGLHNNNGKFKNGHSVPKEWRDNLSKLKKGIKQSKETCEKKSKAHKEIWKNPTKEMLERLKYMRSKNQHKISEEGRKKIGEANRKRIISDASRKKSSLRMKGNKNPFYNKTHSKETKKHISDLAKKRTGSKNPFYGKQHSEETKEKLRKFHTGLKQTDEQIKKRLQCRKNRVAPNKKEKLLIELFKDNKLPYKFVGDGEIIIGRLNPDFINVNGQKKLIELFGNYWHNPKHFPNVITEKERKKSFKKYGFETLVIWEKELNNPKKVLEKVRGFNNK